jgi:hypothetical protein
MTDVRKAIAGWVVLVVLLVAPAIWNGFPLVFYDTAGYLGNFRYPASPPFYTAWVVVTSLRTWPELVVLAQGLATAVFLITVFSVVVPAARRRTRYATVLAIVAVLPGQLPWLVSWLMPDFLAGIAFLSVIVLMLFWNGAPRLQKALLASFVLFGCLVATANVALCAMLCAVCFVLRAWVAGQALWKGRVVLPAAAVGSCVIFAILLMMAANMVRLGKAEYSPVTGTMTFARLADVGLAQPQMPALCARKRYPICAFLPELARHHRHEQNFLWDGLADRTDAFGAGNADYAELGRQIIAADPVGYMREGLADGLALAAHPTLDEPEYEELRPQGADWGAGQRLTPRMAATLDRLSAARQQHRTLLAAYAGRFYRGATFLSYVLLALLSWRSGRKGDRAGAALGLATFAAIGLEIVLHGLLVGPYPRYHTKVSWLGWVVVVALVARWRRRAPA